MVFIENAVMHLHGIIRKIKCHIVSSTQEPVRDYPSVLPWSVEHARNILSRCQKGRDHSSDCTANDHIEKSSHSERKCWQDRYQVTQWTE